MPSAQRVGAAGYTAQAGAPRRALRACVVGAFLAASTAQAGKIIKALDVRAEFARYDPTSIAGLKAAREPLAAIEYG